MEHGKPHRLMAVWTAAHDNGWVTSVVENPDGTFAAWAAPDGESAGVYTIQPDVDQREGGGRSRAAAAYRTRRMLGRLLALGGSHLRGVRSPQEDRVAHDGPRGGGGAADGGKRGAAA